MVNQAYHTLNYHQENTLLRPSSTYANKVRPTPYEAPSRNSFPQQQQQQQQQLIQQHQQQITQMYGNGLIPTLYSNQPLNPFNFYANPQIYNSTQQENINQNLTNSSANNS
ncbi:unnamed protein product, partial [Brachionus calyciflorus]